ncbi:MAG: hypothetical protein NTW87_17685 [Planctomycetota bacterium]|nr:hypothetical protein [Planctomycetota bacterium]
MTMPLRFPLLAIACLAVTAFAAGTPAPTALTAFPVGPPATGDVSGGVVAGNIRG